MRNAHKPLCLLGFGEEMEDGVTDGIRTRDSQIHNLGL